MDYRGQALAEQVTLIGVILAAVVAFIVGWTNRDFNQLAAIYGTGVLLVALVTLPDHPWWPFSRLFNAHPIQWLPPLGIKDSDEAPEEPTPPTQASFLSTVGAWLGLGSKPTSAPPANIKRLREKASRAAADKKK